MSSSCHLGIELLLGVRTASFLLDLRFQTGIDDPAQYMP